MDKNTSHLAGEFLVAGELARHELAVSITFGNAKSVDIYAQSAQNTYRVDAKALRGRSNWPVNSDNIDPGVVYVFVCLGSKRDIKNNNPPQYFIVPGNVLPSLITHWKKRSGVTYKKLNGSVHANNWSIFK